MGQLNYASLTAKKEFLGAKLSRKSSYQWEPIVHCQAYIAEIMRLNVIGDDTNW